MGIGKELKRLREEVPISAEKIADRIGVKATRWRKWEELDQKPRLEDTNLIEAFFKMSMKDLVKRNSIKEFLNVPHGTNLNKQDHIDLDKPLAAGNLVVTLADYVDLLKSQRDSYERIITSGLVKIQSDINQSRLDNHGRASAIKGQIEELGRKIHQDIQKFGRDVPLKEQGKTPDKSQKKTLKQGNHDGVNK